VFFYSKFCNMIVISTSVAVAKKPKLAVSAGVLPGFVPAAIRRRSKSKSKSSSAVITASAASGHGDSTINSDADFKMGGLENHDEGGNEVPDMKYPKYAEMGGQGKRGYQVHNCMSLNICAQRLTLFSIDYSQCPSKQTNRTTQYFRDAQECHQSLFGLKDDFYQCRSSSCMPLAME
jgi:hypothetical protein